MSSKVSSSAGVQEEVDGEGERPRAGEEVAEEMGERLGRETLPGE